MDFKDFNYDTMVNYKNIRHICFNLTNQCNCRCIYCFTHHNPRRMSLDTFKTAITWALENTGFERGTFFGGEPMLEYDSLIVPIVEWCEKEKLPISWGMTTNGTHFTDERLDWLKHHHVGFLLSIDGGQQSQDYNRPLANGKGSFNLIEPFIPRIVKDFPGTTFRSTVTPFSAHNLLQDYLYARKAGFSTYYIVPDCLGEKWTKEDLNALYHGYADILEIMYRDIACNISPLIVSQFVKSIRAIMPHYIDPNLPMEKPTINRCGLGTVSLGISPEGFISGCQEHSTYEQEETPFYIGDIYNGIDKEKHTKLLKMIIEMEDVNNPNMKCKNCPSRSVCNIQYCPSHNWLNCHHLNVQDDLSCEWQNFQNQQALLLVDKGARENNGLFLQFILEQLSR